MFVGHFKHLLSLLPVLAVVVLGGGCAGQKPGALVWAERFAEQLKRQPGCTATLRQWFTEVNSAPHPKDDATHQIPIPRSLDSQWWRHARATAIYSKGGKLNYMSVSRDEYEVITIGPSFATPQDLHLTHSPGEPPVFPAKVADGIYAWLAYK